MYIGNCTSGWLVSFLKNLNVVKIKLVEHARVMRRNCDYFMSTWYLLDQIHLYLFSIFKVFSYILDLIQLFVACMKNVVLPFENQYDYKIFIVIYKYYIVDQIHASYLCSYVYSYNISYKPCTMCVPFLKNEKTVNQEYMLKELFYLLSLVCLHSM